MKRLVSIAVFCSVTQLYAQITDTTVQLQKTPLIQWSGYAELYYQHNSNGPTTNTNAAFVYSHDQNKRPSVNLAYIKGQINRPRFRSNLALALGSYMRANYASENGISKHILEANIGVKPINQLNLWVDIGVFPSHIGFESAVGKDCWTLTRSIAADNSPYFETGVKLVYTSPNEQWLFSTLLLTGWQSIAMVKGNTKPSFGHQIQFKPNKKWTVNSSSFIGQPYANSTGITRLFHNFYAMYQWTNQVGLILGFDIGWQKNSVTQQTQVWHTPVIMAQYAINQQLKMALRSETYHDKTGVMIPTGTPNGFNVRSWSFNLDYQCSQSILCRFELKQLQSKDAIFFKSNNEHTTEVNMVNAAIVVSL
jgi:hypothetical protein